MKIVSLLLVSFVFILTGCFKTYDSDSTSNSTDSQYLQVSNFTDDISESNNGDVSTSTTSPSSPTSTSTSTLISIEKYIAISFSEVIDANTVNVSSAYIKDKNQLAIAAELTVVGNQINIIPNEFFLPNERYTIVITTAVKDIHGRTLKNEFNYTFVTTPVETTLPNDAVPSLVTLSPANGTKASVTTDIVMIFSEDIAGNGSLIVKDSNTNGIVSGTNTINGSSLRFVPQNLLAYDANYSVTLQGTVEDLEGNAYVGLTNWSFSVTPENDTAAPVLQQLTPAANTQASASTYVRMVFDEVIAGNGNIKLKNSDTNVVINGTTSKFDNILHFIPQSELSPGTNYTVTLQGNVTDLSGNVYTGLSSWDFSTTPLVDTTLPTLLALTPADAATDVAVATDVSMSFTETIADNGVTLEVKESVTNAVVDGAVSISGNTLSFNPANDLTSGTEYIVTVLNTVEDLAGNAYTGVTSWSFTTVLPVPPGDTTPPALDTLTPADAATDVAVATDVSMSFTETIADNGVTLEVKESVTNTVVDGVVSISGNTLSFNPANDLTSGTEYIVTVLNTVEDLAGNAYTGVTSWSFTAVLPVPPGDTTPPTLDTLTPADAATDVAVATDVSMSFTETIADNGVTLEVKESVTNAVVDGVVSISGNTVSFNPANDLTSGTEYIVTVLNTVEDLAGNAYTGVTSWSFTTVLPVPPGDTTPPALDTLTPADAATDVAVATDVSMSFTETIADNGVTLEVKESATNAVVDGVVSISGNTLSFNPANDLTSGTEYIVTVLNTVEDLAGNAYTGVTSWSFTTVLPVPPGDTTPPTLLGLIPSAGATGVNSTTDIVMIFNENIANNGATLEVKESATSAVFSGVVTISGDTLSFNPTSDLTPGANYVVTLQGNVEDLSGNIYTGQISWSFTTVVDTTPPTLVSFTPAEGTTVDGTTAIIMTFDETVQNTGDTLKLTNNWTSSTVDGTSGINANTLWFIPDSPLVMSTYTVTVQGPTSDLSGNLYVGQTSWSFDVSP